MTESLENAGTIAELQDALNEIANTIQRPKEALKIFVAIPNMNSVCVGLVNKLFHWALQRTYDPWFHFVTEKRHADYARNLIGQAFLESGCNFLSMIDADVDPHIEFLKMAELEKDVVAGNVNCWLRGELVASIWQRSECEQCRNVRIWQEKRVIHDPSQYRVNPDNRIVIDRWEPFHQRWQQFASLTGIMRDQKCRCKGTGFDPFVYRSHQKLMPYPMQVDSVGTAAVMIDRHVIEEMAFPWFQFLYRPSREILLTEDHYFCWKAKEYGFEVWADPKLLCSHYKTVDLMQLTGLVNKAYQMGMHHAMRQQSIVIPDEEKAEKVVEEKRIIIP